MTTESVCQTLQQCWACTFASASDCTLGCSMNCNDIHSVNFLAMHTKYFSFTPDFRMTCCTVVIHSNSPFIIFNHKYDGQLPKLRHIKAFIELTNVACAITKKRCRYRVATRIGKSVFFVQRGKRSTKRDWNSLPDKSKTTKKMMFPREKMHRATATLATSCRFTKQLTHHF